MIPKEEYEKAKETIAQYHLQNLMIPKEAEKLLSEVYGSLWTEAYYDGNNLSTIEFAKPLADKMMELNAILKFKK